MVANRRDISKAETRDLILKTAQKMFCEKGVEKCTLRDIAKKAGVSPASIVVHFKNKASLLETALYEDIEFTVSEAIRTLPGGEDILTKLLHTSQHMFIFYNKNKPLYRSLLKETLLEPEKNNPLITTELNQYIRFIACLFEEEIKKKTLIKGTDSEQAAMSVMSLYIGVLIMFFRDIEMTPEAATDLLKHMTSMFLTGIRKRR